MAQNGPETPSLAHQRQALAAEICRDLYAGPLAVRGAGTRYLPQFSAESNDDYDTRLSTSVCYDAFGRTVDGLTGMVHRKPPKLADGMPSQITELWENIDNLGTHGEVFCQHRHRDGEIDGHFVIFVDMPPRDPDARTLADVRNRNARPYWIGIRKQDVLAAEHTPVGATMVLTHFRYRETVTERDGYADVQKHRIREYNLGAGIVEFTLWEKNPSTNEYEIVSVGEMDIDEIPVSVGYHGERLGAFESRPPHIALALENIKHYQLVSDNDNVMHLTCVPKFVRVGYEDPAEGTVISPSAGLDLPIGGDAKWVSPAADGFEHVAKRIEKSEHRMAVLGISPLMGVKTRPETATGERIEKAESDSALSSHARATQDAVEEAIRLTAKWLNVDLPNRTPESRWVAFNRDFEALHIDAQTVSALAGLVRDKSLSLETLWDLLQRGGLLTDEFDPEIEADRIEAQVEASLVRMREEMQARPPLEDAA